MKYSTYSLLLYIAILGILSSCKNESENIVLYESIDEIIAENPAYAKVGKLRLSEYGFFMGNMAQLKTGKRLFSYDLNSPLFTDYASKKRFIYLPENSLISYREDEALDFPIGTVLIKNFLYKAEELNLSDQKIIETRLLIQKEEGWVALPYIWNKEQTEAYLEITGGNILLDHSTQGEFIYSVPSMNQCKSCHEVDSKITPIGPTVRQLNFDNQLQKLVDIDFLDSIPDKGMLPRLAQWDNENESINDRARAYLDINCAHCHRNNGPAKNSGLSLRYNEEDSYALGINKRPVAAGKGSGGFSFDIEPGNPNESILLHRMKINEPGTRMPELGRNLVHNEGVALIEEWIEGMNE